MGSLHDDIAKAASIRAAVGRFANKVIGRNIDDVAKVHVDRIMAHPFVQHQIKTGPQDLSTFRTYLEKTIRGPASQIPRASSLPRKTKGRMAILDALTRGRNEVAAAQGSTRRARGLVAAGTVAAPTAGVAGYKEVTAAVKKPTIKDKVKSVAPVAAGVAAGAAPIAQGVSSGALRGIGTEGQKFKSLAELRKNLRPGDVVLTSPPGKNSIWKTLISAIGGDPHGHHVESIMKVPKGGPGRLVEFMHANTGEGAARNYKWSLKSEPLDMIVRRFKNPEHAKQYIKNLRALQAKEEVVGKVLGEYARGRMYDQGAAIGGGTKSFLPEFVRKLLPGKYSPGAAVCSSLPGQASPVCLAKGVPRAEIMPHHVRASKALKTVGSFTAPTTLRAKAYHGLLRAAPWALRAAIGAGLGYGAYRGVKALTD